MINPKQTPWKIGDTRTKFGGRLVYDSIDDMVADCSTSIDDVKRQEANARLISAAPDLLEALTLYLEGAWNEPGFGVHYDTSIIAKATVKARAAIARAKGAA